MGKRKKKIDSNKMTDVVMSIVRTHDIMNRFLEIELGKHGSNPPRFAVMNALLVHDGTMRPTEISNWIFRAKHTVTSMLKALENVGYVKRIANESDRRSVDILVTEKGWRSTDNMLPIAEDISKKILSCLDEKEIDTLLDILRKIRKHSLIQLSAPKITSRSENHHKT
jgi:DNA-binding MarR family transcriptional regulator